MEENYDKLSPIDKLIYDMYKKRCDNCPGFDECPGETDDYSYFKGKDVVIYHDKTFDKF